ncbi:MAG: hypothetical protein LAN64_09225 [Acidobacteriia bacterium]|nr:hypothetical protein [Terriglobia bacterium]
MRLIVSCVSLLLVAPTVATACVYPLFVNTGLAGWPPCVQKIEVHVSSASFSSDQFNAVSAAFSDWESNVNYPFGPSAFIHFEMHHDTTTVAAIGYTPYVNVYQVLSAPSDHYILGSAQESEKLVDLLDSRVAVWRYARRDERQ